MPVFVLLGDVFQWRHSFFDCLEKVVVRWQICFDYRRFHIEDMDQTMLS